MSGDDPLATCPGIPLIELLGVSPTDRNWTRTEQTRHCGLKMEAIWADKVPANGAERQKAYAFGKDNVDAQSDTTSEGADHRGSFVEKGKKLMHRQAVKMEDWWNKHTGNDAETLAKLDTRLELEVTWRPWEINDAAARSIKPGTGPEKFTSMLFVGLRECTELPMVVKDGAEDATASYYAKVQCLPIISDDGVEVTTPDKQSCIKSSKARKVQAPADAARDRNASLHRKAMLLVQNDTPMTVIADVLDVPEDDLDEYLKDTLPDNTAQVAVQFNQGFYFLLPDPRAATVTITVYRTQASDEEVGTLSYDVTKLLGCRRLRQSHLHLELKGPNGGGAKANLDFQLWTPFDSSCNREIGRLDEQVSEQMRLRRQNRVVYLDRLGRKRVQVDGLWVDEDDDDEA